LRADPSQPFGPAILFHVVVPIIGAPLLIPGFFSVAGITGIPGLSFIFALTSPYSYAPFVMAAWLLIGVTVLFWLRSGRPDAISQVAHIHLETKACGQPGGCHGSR
jgi:hypothetical protein